MLSVSSVSTVNVTPVSEDSQIVELSPSTQFAGGESPVFHVSSSEVEESMTAVGASVVESESSQNIGKVM